jgi:hypothetical protein
MAVAPAIGNAILDATGQRLSNLPLIPNGLKKLEGRNLECGGFVYPEPRRAAAFTVDTNLFLCRQGALPATSFQAIDTRAHPAYLSAPMNFSLNRG